MSSTERCPHCGQELHEEDETRGVCPSCKTELRPTDQDRPASPEELSEEASRDSFPSSDPPAW